MAVLRIIPDDEIERILSATKSQSQNAQDASQNASQTAKETNALLYRDSNELIQKSDLKDEVSKLSLNIDLIETENTDDLTQMTELKIFEHQGASLTVLEAPFSDSTHTDPAFARILQSENLSLMLNTDICQSFADALQAKSENLILGCYDLSLLSLFCEEYHSGKHENFARAKRLLNQRKSIESVNFINGVLYLSPAMVKNDTLLGSFDQTTGHFIAFSLDINNSSFVTLDSLTDNSYFSDKIMKRLAQFIHRLLNRPERSIRKFSFAKNITKQRSLECGTRALLNLTLFSLYEIDFVIKHTLPKSTYTDTIIRFKKWIQYIVSSQTPCTLVQ